MKVNKADLMYNGKSFLEIQIEKGRALGIDDIIVSGYERKCSARVVPDRLKEKGPLGGIEACLRKIENPCALVVGVDTPLLPVEDLRKMIESAEHMSHQAMILNHGGREESLIGIYHKSLIGEMVNEIATGKGSVFACLNRLGYDTYVSEAPARCFKNINTFEDYKRILNLDEVQIQVNEIINQAKPLEEDNAGKVVL